MSDAKRVIERNRAMLDGLQTLARLVLDGHMRGIDPTSWEVTPHDVKLQVKWPDALLLARRILPDTPMAEAVTDGGVLGPGCTHRMWRGQIGDVKVRIAAVTTAEEEERIGVVDDLLEPIGVLDVLIASTLPDDDATVGAE